VLIPCADGWRADYVKVRIRDAIDFPLAGIAVALKREGDRIAGLRLAITAPIRALMVPTDALVGASWNRPRPRPWCRAVRKTSNVLLTTVAVVKYRRSAAGHDPQDGRRTLVAGVIKTETLWVRPLAPRCALTPTD
jgi:4-hydroxybenzoyl-CoA reductase subunit beta